MFPFLFLFFSMLLITMRIFQIKRIFSSEKWFNYVVTFFLKMTKIWVGQTTLNGEKRGWPNRKIYIFYSHTNFSLYMVHSSLLISYFEKLSTCLWTLPFALNVILNLSSTYPGVFYFLHCRNNSRLCSVSLHEHRKLGLRLIHQCFLRA